MNRRTQRGTIDHSPLLWILPILVLVGWYNWPGGPPDLFGIPATTWFTWIAWIIGGLLALMVIAGFVVRRLEAREDAHRQEVARAVGSKVELEFRGGWGRSTIHYYVPLRRHDYPVKVRPSRGSTDVVLEVERGGATPFAIDVAPDGTVNPRAAGQDAARAFLDERMLSSLAGMAKIGKPAGLALLVVARPDSLAISRYGAMSVQETLLFLDLCWPVLDRALAHCFGRQLAAGRQP